MTRRLSLEALEEVSALLHAGLVVAVPTDTVYGVAAVLADANAVARLFALKSRPTTTALPVMIGSLGQLGELGLDWNASAAILADSFWPGALTIVVSANEELARRVGSDRGTLGVRLPDDADLRAILDVTGPLAVTSANAHGEPACHDAGQVVAAFEGHDDLAAVVDGGRRDGAVSTVVDVSGGTWTTLRSGAISDDQIAQLLA